MKKILAYLLIGLLTLLLTMSWLSKRSPVNDELTATHLNTIVRKALNLSVLEIHISQLYEANKHRIRIANLPVPLTSQKSLLVVRGSALIGVDLNKSQVKLEETTHEVSITLPPPMVLSLDAEIRTLYENDYFLNRISVQERNQTLAKVRKQVRETILTKPLKEKAEAQVTALLEQWLGLVGYKLSLTFTST